MFALWALIFAIGASSGASVAYWIKDIEVKGLEADRNLAKATAITVLAEETRKVEEKASENHKIAVEKEKADAQHVQTINTLHDKLVAAKLRPRPLSTSSCNTKGTSGTVGTSESETNSSYIPAGLHGFLTERTLIADRNTKYALECYDFVIAKNCGISKEPIKPKEVE